MKKLTWLLAFSWLYIQLPAQDSFTLEEALRYGMQNQNAIKKDKLMIEDANADILEYKAIGIPKLNASLNLTHFIILPTSILPQGSFFPGDANNPPNPEEDLAVRFGTKNNVTAGLELSTLLFSGSFFVGLQAIKMYKELQVRNNRINETEIRYQITRAYLGVLLARENLAVLDKNIQNLESVLNQTRGIFQAGFAEKIDVDRLELSLANLKVEQQKVKNLEALSLNLLKFQMGYPMDKQIQVTQGMQELMPDSYQENKAEEPLSVDRRPEYRAATVGMQLAELNIKQLKAGYIPSLAAFAGYQQVLQGNSLSGARWYPASTVGVNLSVPIFDGLDKTAKLQKARVTHDKTQLDVDDLIRAIQLQSENARTSYRNALQNLASTEKNVALAKSIYEVTQKKFAQGVGASLEMSQAESNLYMAQSQYINAQFEVLNARVDLDKALGNL